MGTDKAWLDLNGVSMIERVIAALSGAVATVSIVANTPEFARLGLPTFSDAFAGRGPLEGIRTALSNSRSSRVVLVACDLPFVTSELFKFLLTVSVNHQATIPIGPDGKLEPTCAVYDTRALPVLNNILASGVRKISDLFDRVPTRFVPFNEISRLSGAGLFFENINTPEDYSRALERFKGH